MDQVYVKPNLLVWARKRAGKTQQDLLKKFPKIAEWEKEDSFPTLRQLENFAKSVYVPIGYLFFSEPPKESLPIPDFRTRDYSVSFTGTTPIT